MVKVPLLHGSDVHGLMRALQERVALVPGIQEQPAPSVSVVEYTALGPVVGVGVSVKPNQAGPAMGAMLHAVTEILTSAGYIVPPQAAQQLLSKAS
ncbi:hypothetical protein JQX13_34645 [Archangium violaceum]|uniref:hypothetical protein n=1 Tax=Archangium violaceum TaxID=83451 RepID=UPI00193AEE94|nr:hypothetical protein [Archangium violaceum]QRK05303.1 hypothetical protein JQX13_34645 [Archangium violaceum]